MPRSQGTIHRHHHASAPQPSFARALGVPWIHLLVTVVLSAVVNAVLLAFMFGGQLEKVATLERNQHVMAESLVSLRTYVDTSRTHTDVNIRSEGDSLRTILGAQSQIVSRLGERMAGQEAKIDFIIGGLHGQAPAKMR